MHTRRHVAGETKTETAAEV